MKSVVWFTKAGGYQRLDVSDWSDEKIKAKMVEIPSSCAFEYDEKKNPIKRIWPGEDWKDYKDPWSE